MTAVAEPIRLNLGCGPNRLPGEIGVDLDPNAGAVDVVANLLSLPYESGTVDQARLAHVLEHFEYRFAPTVLLEVYRVLRPGGTVIVQIPDLLATCRAFVETHETTEATRAERLAGKMIAMRHLYGGQMHPGQEHLGGYDPEMIEDMMRACGYVDVDVQIDYDRGDVIDSLIATGTKPL